MKYLGYNRRWETIMSTYCISIWDKSFFIFNKWFIKIGQEI